MQNITGSNPGLPMTFISAIYTVALFEFALLIGQNKEKKLYTFF